jgi:hypothetical protein
MYRSFRKAGKQLFRDEPAGRKLIFMVHKPSLLYNHHHTHIDQSTNATFLVSLITFPQANFLQIDIL